MKRPGRFRRTSPMKPRASGMKRLTGMSHRASGMKRHPTGRAEPERPLAIECQVAIAHGCGHWAAHRHHVLPRSAGGSDDASNTLDVCRACHEWIHAHPSRSYASGWLARRS